MEDYMYYFELGNEMILGLYMFEVCLIVVLDQLKIEVYLFFIGGKEDFVCFVFNGISGLVI